MQANDADVGAAYHPQRVTAISSFRSPDDLHTWGWSPFPPDRIDEKFHDFYATWGIGDALVDLGVSEHSDIYEGGENRLIFIDHQSYDAAAGNIDEQWYDVDGKDYRATGASYSFAINPVDGVILGLNRLSPIYAAEDRKPPVPKDQIPVLNQFSDIAWIGWETMTRGGDHDITKLRFFVSVGINNAETKSVIRRALDAKGWELAPWPGHTFERQWFETRAIVGMFEISPHQCRPQADKLQALPMFKVSRIFSSSIKMFWATCSSTRCKCFMAILRLAIRASLCTSRSL